MVITEFFTQEDLKKREDSIKKDKETLLELKDKRFDLKRRASNLTYDVNFNFPEREDLKEKLDELTKELAIMDEKIDFYISDIAISEHTLKADKRISKIEQRRRWRADMQAKTVPAKRNKEPYSREELIEMVQEDHDDKVILDLALGYKRTWYAIEHIIRSKDFYLKHGRLPKIESVYIEPVSELLEQSIKLVHNI
ncbi:MAG: hypothetical protein IH948_00035 [Bacteroidetes bacterium]|nr:hypothetical protein [Bacteroidota bacterium]